MPIQRVALIFDNGLRPETTGLYCRRALGSLVEVEHFLPEEAAEIPRDEFDLYLTIDDGLDYRLPDDLGPSAYWAIDTHVDFKRALENSRAADFVFAAQQNGAERLRTAGVAAEWLPLACDPVFHRPHEVETLYDLCFVGHRLPGPREELLQLLQSRSLRTFIGRRFFEQMAQTYAASRVVFNRSVADDLNMRVFEALGCGAFLLTNALDGNGQDELFQDGRHLATYREADELLDKLDYYLKHDEARRKIAQAGRAEVLARHTYLHRMTQLLRSVERRLQPTRLMPENVNDKRVSACLLSWKRPENVRRIVEELRRHPFIDDITVWNNNPDCVLELPGENVRVVNGSSNQVTYARFLCAQQARHPLIYTQDDDCLVHNVEELFETFLLDPSRITHALKLGHLIDNAENFFVTEIVSAEETPPEPAQVALLGWGAFFRREWTSVFDRYRDVYGEDELLIRKADRIFSLLLNRRHRSLPAIVGDLPGASGSEALSVRDDHFELTRQAISRSLTLLQNSSAVDSRPEEARGQSATANRPETGDSAVRPAKDDGYFEFDRPEVVALIPPSARRVLDVGCGAGRLGAALKRRQSCEVVGLELNPQAAAAARARLDEVIVGNIETAEIEFPRCRFDCVVCADVLEHLRDPLSVLRRIREWLTDDGCLVASIPNVRHHTVVRSLLAGNWSYEPAGLLDEDHVRFFTRREIEKLLFRAGFAPPELSSVPGPGYQEWVDRGRPSEVKAGSLHFSGATPEEAEEFYVYQYLLRAVSKNARRAAGGNRSKTDAENAAKADQAAQRRRLAAAHPWPGKKPDVPIPAEDLGWLADGARQVLVEELNDCTTLVVELGAWLGLSTRFIAATAADATVVTIDHWRGSAEHQEKPRWEKLLPQLYETFQALCWEDRNRIVPLKMTTQAGLKRVADYGLSPDVIFFDADHSYDAVSADLELCRRLFPGAVLVGDDYDAPGVAQAVDERAGQDGLAVRTTGTAWRGWMLPARQPAATPTVPPRDDGLTSIIIPTHNQWSYTRQCLESIRYRTDEPYELIVVDNGSSDGTPEFLRAQPDVRLIANSENRGFPAAVNQGIRAARGEQVLLLNNDTLVTTGWLRRLLDALHGDDRIGLVGPCSNYVTGPQQIRVDYDDLNQLDGFAWCRSQRLHGQLQDADRLVGFCLLIGREVVDAVGLFDEQFGIGNFEDDDYCRRALAAGFRSVIAQDAFVHHFGSQTFRAIKEDFAAILRENEEKYRRKWAAQESGGNTQPAPPEPSPPFRITQTPQDGLPLDENTLKLSLCMIVRDNETTIGPALESIRPWVDEIVVVDTGSTDRTPEICKEHGARLFHFPWCDDFSAARNESIKHARGEWIFWMDSDDTIPAANGRMLRDLANGHHPSGVLGYVMQVHCPGACDREHDVTVVDHVKLFRNRPDLRFEHRIHEQIIPAIRRAGGDVAFTDVYVTHSGSDHTAEGKARKLERDLRILQQDLDERPEHPFVLFNLGMTYADVPDCGRAVEFLKRCLDVSDPGESHVRKAYALMASAHHQAGEHDDAWETCKRGLELFPDDKELLFRAGILHQHQGRLDESAAAYSQALDGNSGRHFASVDAGIAGFKARHNLALVYEEMQELQQAEEQWRLAVAERPHYRAGWLGLGETLLKQQRFDETGELARRLKAGPETRGTGAVLAARLFERQANPQAARRELESVLDEIDGDTQPLQELSRLLFERFNPAEALDTLERLTVVDPTDASVQHNLATAYERHGRLYDAVTALKRSLELRPDAPATSLQLATLLQQLDRPHEARAVLQTALSRSPDHPELSIATERLEA